jgi:hypothetical protein
LVSAILSAGDAFGTRDRLLTTDPGSARNRMKLNVMATKQVTIAWINLLSK